MSILERVKSAVGAGSETEFTYNCRDCDATFESTESHMGEVACPYCESRDIRQLV
ncbi:hypothetical protein [Halomarina litorea]|uniref:hypothetical protein n=1 Tax=Halomarina litorea TaxID=2961595 RepID=UPI0020C2F553|nr:hypothetical protein [Halomarina sp. BCD28]